MAAVTSSPIDTTPDAASSASSSPQPGSPSSSASPASNPASSPQSTHEIRVHLRSIPFFTDIEESKLHQLASLFEFCRCASGEVICKQGDEANGFSIIVSGTVRVTATGPGGHELHLNTLKDGEWFGEIALVQNTLRTATLTAITPCVFFFLSSSAFRSFLSIAPEIRQSVFDNIIPRRTANSLKAIPLFSFLSRAERGGGRVFDESKLQLLGELFRFQPFAKNELVFAEGDEADAFYIIQRGTVGVWARKGENDEEMMDKSRRHATQEEGEGDDDDDDEEDDDSSDCSCDSDRSPSRLPPPALRTASSPSSLASSTQSLGIHLTDLTKNDWFGEIALVSNTRRTATVICKTACVMLKLSSTDFTRFMNIVPEVKQAFGRVMNVRIAQTLSNIPFFRAVREQRADNKLGVLGSMFSFAHYSTGEVVAREGEAWDKFVLVVDGTVQVSKTVQTPAGPLTIVLEQLTKNQWFGEMQLIRNEPLLSSFTCLTGDHRVMTRCGWKSITQVQVGDEALSFNIATHEMEWKPVLAVTSHAVDPRNAADSLFRMQGSGMDIIATRDHRMLLARIQSDAATGQQVRKPVGYETVGELLGLKYRSSPLSSDSRSAYSLSRAVVCSGFNTQPGVKVVIPGLEQVCDWWWQQDGQLGFLQFLGFWLCDGHLHAQSGDVCIDQQKEASDLWLSQQLLSRVFPHWWHRSEDAARPDHYAYNVLCPPLFDYLRVMAIGPLGYNPREPKQLRSYPHFTKDEQLAATEQQSDYYMKDHSNDCVSRWTQADMLAAMRGDAPASPARRSSFSAATTEPSSSRSASDERRCSFSGYSGDTQELVSDSAIEQWRRADCHGHHEDKEGKEAPADRQPVDSERAQLHPQPMDGDVSARDGVNCHWFSLKRWLGAQNVANVFSQLSRRQAIALLDGFCRADGSKERVQYDDSGEPTGQWRCSSSSFPLIDHLMLIGQLAGAAVDLQQQCKAGQTATVDGRTATFSVEDWTLSFSFSKPAGGLPFQTAPLAQPVDVSEDVEGRGYYGYKDDGRVWCLTVEGNSNFLTQRLSETRLEGGGVGVRAHSVFVGNCLDHCLFLSVSRDRFARFIKISPEIVDHFSALVTWRTASMLRGVDLFNAGIREDRAWSKREWLCSMFEYEFCLGGKTVMEEGDTASDSNKFFIIQQGTVRLVTGAARDGQQRGQTADEQQRRQQQQQPPPAAEEKVEAPSSSASDSVPASAPDEPPATVSRPSSNSSSPRASLSIQITPSSSAPPSSSSSSVPSVRILSKGQYFGDLSLLRPLPRPCTVTTLTPCVFLTLSPFNFHQFCKVAPEIREGLAARYPQYAAGAEGRAEGDPVSPLRVDDDDGPAAGGAGAAGARTEGDSSSSGGGSGSSGPAGKVVNNNIFAQRVKEEQALERRHTSAAAVAAGQQRLSPRAAGGRRPQQQQQQSQPPPPQPQYKSHSSPTEAKE